jgi:hypothetical protein
MSIKYCYIKISRYVYRLGLEKAEGSFDNNHGVLLLNVTSIRFSANPEGETVLRHMISPSPIAVWL